MTQSHSRDLALDTQGARKGAHSSGEGLAPGQRSAKQAERFARSRRALQECVRALVRPARSGVACRDRAQATYQDARAAPPAAPGLPWTCMPAAPDNLILLH